MHSLGHYEKCEGRRLVMALEKASDLHQYRIGIDKRKSRDTWPYSDSFCVLVILSVLVRLVGKGRVLHILEKVVLANAVSIRPTFLLMYAV